MPTATSSPETGQRSPGSAERNKKVNDEPLRIVLTSLDQNVDAFAREAAHKELQKKEGGPFWKRMAKSAWREMSHESQVVKKTKEKRAEILSEGNLLHHQGKSDEQWREATVDRYSSEYGEHLIHEGETFHKLHEAQTDPESQKKADRIMNDLREIGLSVARGEVTDDDSLHMMIDEARQAWQDEKISQDFIGEGQILAENIAPKFRELEAMINSAEGLSDVDKKEAMAKAELAKMEIVAGEARVGSRTEIDSTLSERVAEKLRKVPFLNEGRIAKVTSVLGNETVVAAMVSAGVYAAKRGASMAGKIVAPGIGAGVVAAIKERNRLIDERDLEARRADAGESVPDVPDDSDLSRSRKLLKKVGIGKSEAEHRAEVAATLYEARPVEELLDDLGKLYNEAGELKAKDSKDFEEAMGLMGQIRARIQIGDRTGARLISFEGNEPEKMEARRFDLDLAMAKLETDMKKTVANPVAQAMLDVPLDGKTPDEKFEELFDAQRNIAEGLIMGEMKSGDKLFRKLVAKRAFKRALAATFMGAAVGGAFKYGAEAAKEAFHVAEEAAAGLAAAEGNGAMPNIHLASFETTDDGSSAPTHIGSPEPSHLGDADPTHLGGNADPTHLGTPASHSGGSPDPTHLGSPDPTHLGTPTHGGNTDPTHLGGNTDPTHLGSPENNMAAGESTPLSDTAKVHLPEGYKADVDGTTSTVTITAPDGKEYAGLGLNQDGSLSKAAQETLRDHGFTVSDHSEIIHGEPHVTHKEVTAAEFVKNHQHEMKHVKVTNFFVNNDPNKSDLNEFGLSNHVRSDGSIVADISSMTANGSFHGASGVNWHEAAKGGHIKLYVSASRGTQSRAFEFTFNTDGKVVIPPGSPAHELFNRDGTLKGGYERVGLNGGKLPDGSENVASLATVVGSHDKHFQDTIKTATFKTAHTYTIQPNAQPAAFTATTSPPQGGYPFGVFTTRRRMGAEEQPQEAEAAPEGTPGISGASTPEPENGIGATPNMSVPASTGPEASTAHTNANQQANPNPNTQTNTGTNTPNSSPGPQASTSSGGAGTGTNPNTNGNGAPQPNPNSANTNGANTSPEGSSGPTETAEQKFLKDLDAEALDTQPGYDFSGYDKTGMRERKQAMRFIKAAAVELGGSDKIAIVARAQELAEAAQAGATGDMAIFYADTLGVLKQSADRVQADAAKEKGNASLIDNLDSETRAMPNFPRLDSYGDRAKKLAARIFWTAAEAIMQERGIADLQAVGKLDEAERAKFQKAVMRRSQRLGHPDQYGNLSPEQRQYFDDAQKVINEAANSKLFG